MRNVAPITVGPASRLILGMRVDATSYASAAGQVVAWANAAESRYVVFSTVNNVMEAFDCPDYRAIVNGADLVTPDGMPLVWGLKWLGLRAATRVYGPDFTALALGLAAGGKIPVGFYGASQQVLDALLRSVRSRHPDLDIAYSYAPPFRPLTPQEDEAVVQAISTSGCRILFVGLSSPKQDVWMAQHRGRIPAVMLGVGAAFDFLSGTKPQAPRWMMRLGLEWLFRLASEPRRLWKRYLKYNPRFVALFALQLLGWQRGEQSS
ncbi:WecB/TagA/CpsF family glycosyltransferase [Paludibaculum fermentans]|uniref:WecB/TagA/CpsF family glycosyltransferase n=1 Tax=Paludibaculum fermentans TaxID=1473598 RepID=A0A7S7NKC3_PALFE|nr:WecB/TagA/CpsF family glycosyltransferase [Paludibaculum fermentans]QOY85217.1 WecB/TagA/CpsF family glycosyltransferase [Paludibaculum fermentans]